VCSSDPYLFLLRALHTVGLKRADIGHSSAAYATAHLEPHADRPAVDAITVNPYFGDDGVEPFVAEAQKHDKGEKRGDDGQANPVET